MLFLQLAANSNYSYYSKDYNVYDQVLFSTSPQTLQSMLNDIKTLSNLGPSDEYSKKQKPWALNAIGRHTDYTFEWKFDRSISTIIPGEL